MILIDKSNMSLLVESLPELYEKCMEDFEPGHMWKFRLQYFELKSLTPHRYNPSHQPRINDIKNFLPYTFFN